MRVFIGVLGIFLACLDGSMAEGREPVPQLPISADYCTILRAFTDADDRRCPTVSGNGPTRSIGRAAIPPGDPSDTKGYFIRFAFDSDVLTNAYQSHLAELSSVLKSDSMADLCLLLVGHTDSSGSATYNKALSRKRARTVQLYLQGVAGVAATRLGTAGHGEAEPLPGFPSSDARNRRVEILAKPKDGNSCG